MLLCAQAAAQWKAAEEHRRHRLLVSVSALLRHPLLGFWPRLSAPGAVASFGYEALLYHGCPCCHFGSEMVMVWGQRRLELLRNLRDDLGLGIFRCWAPVLMVEASSVKLTRAAVWRAK